MNHEHAYEELPNGTVECFECGARLSRREWAQRRKRDLGAQIESCPAQREEGRMAERPSSKAYRGAQKSGGGGGENLVPEAQKI